MIIVQLFTTSGLGGPTRQCLRENEQQLRGSSYPTLLWKIRSDLAKESLCFLELNSGAPKWVTTYKWIACWVWLHGWPREIVQR